MQRTRHTLLVVLTAITAVSMLAATAMAQPGGGRGGRPGGGFGGGFGGGGFGGSGLLDVALREEVQEHLELLPDQVDDLKKLAEAEREGQRERMRGLFGGFDRNASEEERAAARDRIRKALEDAAAETKAKVDQVLLPHQSKRLSQLAMQRRLRGGIGGALSSDSLADELGISASQRETLQAKVRAAEEELREKMAKLRSEMQDELLQSLTAAQRAKYKDLVGEPFEFAQDTRGGGRGGDGGGGGRPTGRPTRGRRPAQ